LQREDLNPMESARAFQKLLDEHGHTQDSLAKLISKDRSTVANAARLLKLPVEAQEMIEAGQLTEGHGRAILSALDQGAMTRRARSASLEGLSVRETERRARETVRAIHRVPDARGPSKTVNLRDLEQRLSRALGTKVAVHDRKGRGHVAVHYESYDELDGILELVLR